MKKVLKWALCLSCLASIAHSLFFPSMVAEANDYNVQIQEENLTNSISEFSQSAFNKSFDLYYQVMKKSNPSITLPELFMTDADTLTDNEKTTFSNSILDNTTQQYIVNLDYYVVDNNTKQVVTNVPNSVLASENLNDGASLSPEYDWYMVVTFDENGTPVIDRNLSSHPSSGSTQNYYDAFNTIFSGQFVVSNASTYTTFQFYNSDDTHEYLAMKNVTFRFAVPSGYIYSSENIYPTYTYYPDGSMLQYVLIFGFLIVITMSTLLYSQKEDHKNTDTSSEHTKHKSLFLNTPVEVMLLADLYALIVASSLGEFASRMFPAMCLLFFLYFFISYNVIYYFNFFKNHMLKQHSLTLKAWKYLRDPVHKLYDYALHIDMTGQDSIRLMVIISINFAILLFINLFYSFDVRFILNLIYSTVLFLLLKKYLSSINSNYHSLLEVIRNIAVGKTNNHIEKDLGIFNPFKPELKDIQTNIETAIAEEVHSQQMKTELITNVSHDLKTPLTSLISYIDILKKENVTEEERIKYLDILDKSSDRLKHLVEDLFEVSKANSGNINLDLMKVDVISLMKQVQVECSDALKKKKLNIRNSFSDEKIILLLDSQKTYRIFENLISNISKYALKGTRVYIDVKDYDTFVEVSMKNISAQELNFDVEDITERFMRGDKSRNTDGSGLGLAIVKSFTELQNGTLKIQIDGDLFKVFIRFQKTEEESKD